MTAVRKSARRVGAAVAAAVTVFLFDLPTVMAQIVESDVDAQPGSTETTQLVTSSTEVRRAVIGLLAVAALAGVLFIVYWYMTGQQARERYARQYGGRHVAGGAQHLGSAPAAAEMWPPRGTAPPHAPAQPYAPVQYQVPVQQGYAPPPSPVHHAHPQAAPQHRLPPRPQAPQRRAQPRQRPAAVSPPQRPPATLYPDQQPPAQYAQPTAPGAGLYPTPPQRRPHHQ